ncbi:hypothetical protein M011DRAFT_292950 [Sporormia fimetaria CBS 119925]|uniref:CID domain-containing protein n=1 Tax=Sporormia fimetaria CBS 119925 TaxID=1340428 RepID=A0A6A6UV99_9PLEO|nr:hypothetical protein M011DRAFT_292950 [Sporormia fimetaria CBS 119925]
MIDSIRTTQASLAESLLKSPGTPLLSDSIRDFCEVLDAVHRKCSKANIETCTQWILANCAPQKERMHILGEHLQTLSKAVVADTEAKRDNASRKRLHFVYLMHDVLHAAKFTKASENIEIDPRPYFQELIVLALAMLSSDTDKAPVAILQKLIQYWFHNGVLDAQDLDSFARKADAAKQRIYTLPQTFGHQHARFYDLPASLAVGSHNPGRVMARHYRGREPSKDVKQLLDKYFVSIAASERPAGRVDVEEDKMTSSFNLPGKFAFNTYGWSEDLCKGIDADGVVEPFRERSPTPISEPEEPTGSRSSRFDPRDDRYGHQEYREESRFERQRDAPKSTYSSHNQRSHFPRQPAPTEGMPAPPPPPPPPPSFSNQPYGAPPPPPPPMAFPGAPQYGVPFPPGGQFFGMPPPGGQFPPPPFPGQPAGGQFPVPNFGGQPQMNQFPGGGQFFGGSNSGQPPFPFPGMPGGGSYGGNGSMSNYGGNNHSDGSQGQGFNGAAQGYSGNQQSGRGRGPQRYWKGNGLC